VAGPFRDFPTWIGLFGPAGMPPDIVANIIRTTQEGFAKSAQAREALINAGIIPAMVTGEAFAKQLASDQAKVAELVKQARILLL
jgi:tripartite-type tricarboxylate transporter receptor subunit TctC